MIDLDLIFVFVWGGNLLVPCLRFLKRRQIWLEPYEEGYCIFHLLLIFLTRLPLFCSCIYVTYNISFLTFDLCSYFSSSVAQILFFIFFKGGGGTSESMTDVEASFWRFDSEMIHTYWHLHCIRVGNGDVVFALNAKIWGRFDESFPADFFFFFFVMEISSRGPVPLRMQGWVNNGSASWDGCALAFFDESRVNSFL